MKRCARCQTEKSVGDFNRSPKNKDGRHSYCRACQKAHYRDNAARHKSNVRRTSKARRQQALDAVMVRFSEGCVDCGSTDIRVLEFDHVRGTKVASVGSMVRRGRALAVIQGEMAKCDVRCRNCHAIVTIERRTSSWHDAYMMR
jgi:ABC-type nickel/cobalt efflux system permease component RcnA